MASLLVIGGSGFFGKSILDAYKRGLLKAYGIDEITILARNAEILIAESPELLHESVSLINADLAFCTSLPMADYVIHAAASTDHNKYIIQPEIEHVNILSGTVNFCRLAPIYFPNSKIIFVSSGAVYGQQPKAISEIREDHPLELIAELTLSKQLYAAAKRDGERAISLLGQSGLNVSIARCFSFIGKYLPRDRNFAIGNFIEDGLNSRPIEVKAQHLVYRSYLYADDLVSWLFKAIDIASPACPTVNIGSNEVISVQDLSKIIANIFNLPSRLPPIDSQIVDRYIPSITLAESIGCSVAFPLTLAITTTISSIQQKP